LLNKQ